MYSILLIDFFLFISLETMINMLSSLCNLFQGNIISKERIISTGITNISNLSA